MSRSLVTDASLAQRLERAEGRANVAFVEARATLQPETGATWHDFDGTLAMYDSPDSPLTQTFGLGLFSEPTPERLAAIEAWFAERDAAVHHETCPLADPALLSVLPDRGYRPVEQSAVLYRELTWESIPTAHGAMLTARRVESSEAARWADTSALGWSEFPGVGDFVRAFGVVSANAAGTHCFLVESDGVGIAAGALGMHDGVALLAGASTRPEWRGRGAQSALLRARLQFALDNGCDVALMAALPGSGSQRNAERQGFRIAYTRTKWSKPVAPIAPTEALG